LSRDVILGKSSQTKNALGSNKECFTVDNLKKKMYFEYKAREKRNRRIGVLLGGTIFRRSA